MSATAKILISYHKPSVLLKSEILTPIHVGRALKKMESKDGKLDDENIKWLEKNMLGDDTGDNISMQNRRCNECTAIYWAWKNYDKLGNPDYIGFAHYRRHFNFNHPEGRRTFNLLTNYYIDECGLNDENIIDKIKDYDIILPAKTDVREGRIINNVKEQFVYYHKHKKEYENAMDTICKLYPQYKEAVKTHNNSKYAYFTNTFIMKKELFFEYSEWFFAIYNELEKSIPQYESPDENRLLGYILERLFGIWVTHLKLTNKKIKFKECIVTFIKDTDLPPEVSPSDENEIPVIMSSDNNYTPYLAVTIKSLIENTLKDKTYVIYILNTDIEDYIKKQITDMAEDNCKIKFVNIQPYINKYENSLFHLNEWFTIATYFRFFIPLIFKKFKKVIYCDCDGVFLDDISKLYNTDIGSNLIGAIKDTTMNYSAAKNKKYYKYCNEFLGLKNPYNYFQAGILIMNIPELLKNNFTQSCINTLKKLKKPLYNDQCVMNVVCENQVHYLNEEWNTMFCVHNYLKDYKKILPQDTAQRYQKAWKNPKFIHYCGKIKPWMLPYLKNSVYFWRYARMTDFWEQIIFENACNYQKEKLNFCPPPKKITLLQKMFSIKNRTIDEKNYKVIFLMGIKIKIRKDK